MKKIVCVLCVLGLLAGCAGTKSEPAPEEQPVQAEVKEEETEKEELTFQEMFEIRSEGIDYLSVKGITVPQGAVLAMIGKDSGSGFWKNVKKGAEQAVEDLNEVMGYSGDAKVKLLYDAPAGEDVSEQTDIIDQMLDKNPDALCIGFVDINSGRTQIELADANGIPVLAVDSGISNPLIVNTCKTDNFKAGAEAARKLCEAIGDSGKVALLVHSSQTESGIDREKGFADEIRQNHPEVELVDVAYRQQDERNADEIVTSVLNEHPDLKAYFGTNDTVTKEILEALAMYQPEDADVLAAGFDASAKVMKAVEEGTVAGVMAQNPYGMGYAAAVAAFRAMAGMENAPDVDTGYYWITAENMEDEKAQVLSYK